jgi:hypothetical protein
MNFEMKNIIIDDEDIKKVEDHFKLSFNDEQKKVIKCLNSTDIQACPGSGKTTTLAAKLMILSEKIPTDFEKGICIITHTNVAVNEIKEKLGIYATRFFKYPNHFGTIQSFIDKFLAIPAYSNNYGYKPYRIDDDIYYEIINELIQRKYRKANFWFEKNKILISDLRYCCKNFSLVKDIYGNPLKLKETTDSYKAALECKNEVLRKGYLCFDDAYSIAFKYLREYPSVKSTISKRFAFLFVDEMQDMDSHQSEILKELFEKTVILQKIGDINQAIYIAKSNIDKTYWLPKDKIEITKSVRFSKLIADKIKNVCLCPQDLGGWASDPQIKPIIIVFKDETILKVKEKFGELILEKGLSDKGNKIFKAIGFRKEHESKRSIKSYLAEFEKENQFIKIDYDFLIDYLQKPNVSIDKIYANQIRKNILNALIKSLRLLKVENPDSKKYYSVSSILKYLSEYNSTEYDKLNLNIVKWVSSIINEQETYLDIKNYIQNQFIKIFNKTSNDALIKFLTESRSGVVSDKGIRIHNNIYQYKTEKQSVNIEFNTIHGVKGETHCATLFLETFNRVYDIEKIIPFIARD